MSIQASPQPRVEEIVKQLNNIVVTESHDELTITRLEREIENIKKDIDPSIYFDIKGMLECVKQNNDLMHKYHQYALFYANNAASSLQSYAVSLKRCKHLNDAYKYAYEAANQDDAFLDLAIKLASFINANELSYLVDRWRQIYPDDHVPIVSDDIDLCKLALDSIENSVDHEEQTYIPADPDQLSRIASLLEGIHDE